MEKNSENDIDSLKERHTELSNSINRILFTLLSFGFFCALTLTQPDEMVIKNGGKIRIPFVSMEVDFLTFLIIGPIALLGITVYLILFMEEMRKYDGLPHTEKQAYIFNLGSKPAKVCSSIMFFGFTPLILLMFYIKSRVNPAYAAYAGTLLVLTTLTMTVYFFYQQFKKKETASAIAIVVVCGLLLLPISPLFNLNSKIPICVSGANLANLNLMGFRLAGAQAETGESSNVLLKPLYQSDRNALFSLSSNRDSRKPGAGLLEWTQWTKISLSPRSVIKWSLGCAPGIGEFLG